MHPTGTEVTEMLAALHRMEAKRKAAIRLGRRTTHGTYLPRGQAQNQYLTERAIAQGTLPPVRHWRAAWVAAYGGLRETWLRLRDDPNPAIRAIGERGKEAMNGYVLFPKRHAPRVASKGLVDFIPVHGGVTYQVKDRAAAVWGFDTNHGGISEKVPRDNVDWVAGQCQLLYTGLITAHEYEREYRRAGRKRRVEIAQFLIQTLDDGRVNLADRLGMGALIPLLFGEMPG